MMNGNMSLFLKILLIRSSVSNSVRTITVSVCIAFMDFLTALAFVARMAGAKVSERKKNATIWTTTVKMDVLKKTQRQFAPVEMYAPHMGATQGASQVSMP